jgi:hypothetical protein
MELISLLISKGNVLPLFKLILQGFEQYLVICVFLDFQQPSQLKGTRRSYWWSCCMYFSLPNIANPMYIEQLTEMVPPTSQNTVSVSNQITLLMLYSICSRLVTLLKVNDALTQVSHILCIQYICSSPPYLWQFVHLQYEDAAWFGVRDPSITVCKLT